MSKHKKLKLYGTIGYWENSARRWSDVLNKAISENDTVDVHLHTPGGDVFEGGVMYNIINDNDKVNTVVDGMAASMGGILLQGGTIRKAAKNSYIMIHAPSGTTHGTAAEHKASVKLLENMEADLLSIFNRANVSDEIKKGWFDGNEHWFSAKEALDIGLIDEIIEPIDRSFKKPTKTDAISINELYNSYTNSLNNKNLNKNDMDFTKFGVTNEAELSAKFTGFTTAITGLNDTIAEKDSTIKELSAKVEGFEKIEKEAFIDNAIKEGKFSAEQKETMLKLAETSFDAVQDLAKNAKTVQAPTFRANDKKDGDGKNPKDRNTWNLSDWRENDPDGLLKVQADDEEQFEAICTRK